MVLKVVCLLGTSQNLFSELQLTAVLLIHYLGSMNITKKIFESFSM